MKERTKRVFAVFGAAWVAVWLLVLLTRTEASLAVRVGGGTYLVAGLGDTCHCFGEERAAVAGLDPLRCLGGRGLRCRTFRHSHRGRVGTPSGWVRALWSAGLLVGAILPVYWTYKRRVPTVKQKHDG